MTEAAKKQIIGKGFINGRRWFERVNGNTYHTVTVEVNGETLKSPITYGYENAFMQTAHKLLTDAGYGIPEGHSYLYDNFYVNVNDVSRKKDL